MTHDERDLGSDLRDLRALDPAHDPRPDAGREPAAQALLSRVLEASQDETSGSDVEQIGDRRRRRRWAVGGVAAAAVAATLVILPLSGEPEHAFATWTAVPQEVPTSALEDVTGCTPAGDGSSMWEQDAIITEQRGRVTFVVALTEFSLRHCLLVDGEFLSSSSSNIRSQPADIAPDEVRTSQASASGSGADSYTAIVGRVGADVIGVEVHPSGPAESGLLPLPDAPEAPGPPDSLESVTATVDSGHYGAWWPGWSEEFELTIHLADGTTLENMPAFEHDR